MLHGCRACPTWPSLAMLHGCRACPTWPSLAVLIGCRACPTWPSLAMLHGCRACPTWTSLAVLHGCRASLTPGIEQQANEVVDASQPGCGSSSSGSSPWSGRDGICVRLGNSVRKMKAHWRLGVGGVRVLGFRVFGGGWAGAVLRWEGGLAGGAPMCSCARPAPF